MNDDVLLQVNAVVQGATVLASTAIGLFFVRFWRRSRDRLFLILACAFWIFAVNRLLLTFVDPASEHRVYIYLVRLLSFSLIIAGIVDKNRREHRRSTDDNRDLGR